MPPVPAPRLLRLARARARRPLRLSLAPSLLLAVVSLLPAPASRAQNTLTVQLTDYAAVPQSGVLVNPVDNAVYVARVNFLREEPVGGLNRFFVCDLNGKLYILDRTTRQFTTYLDFQGNTAEIAGATGLFRAFTRAQGYANGLVTFQFDPAYRDGSSPHFGKFYTVHIETDTEDGDPRRLPQTTAHPGLANAAAYSPTTAAEAPGTDSANTRHAVLIEWQDTNPANTTFEGTARELLRIEFNGRIHPLGDLIFNPRATSSAHPDWRNLYLAVGDGGAGEQNNAVLHPTPQRLDVLQGKILRLHPDDPDGPGPLRYGIPPDNPFTGAAVTVPAGTRPEIWAYGFRNPHRLAWDPVADVLLAADIGFHTWEEVNLVRRGANYGYGEREGTAGLDLRTGRADVPLPADDAALGYVYPVLQYPHSPALGYGDAVAGGFVYRGTRLPALQGKYVFGDITTGRLFHADLADLVAADDGNPATLARFHRLDLRWDNPRNPAGPERFDRLYEIVADEYRARGGRDADLPGSATVSDLTGGGRADIRLATDAAGELYVLSKSDGMIRALVPYTDPSTTPPAILRQPVSQTVNFDSTVVFSVEAAADAVAYQWKRNGTPIPGATASFIMVAAASDTARGDYTVDVSRGSAVRTSDPARLSIAPTSNFGRISNFSIRSRAGSGNESLIVGFALDAGPDARPGSLLARAIGPTLADFGVTGVLADPRLQLFQGTTRIAENDNWGDVPGIAALAAAVGAFALPAGSRDAALAQPSVGAGAFTLQVAGPAGSSGVALAELFDIAPVAFGIRRLANVSARTQVGTGEQILIAGFSVGGGTARTFLVRAAGPALAGFGVGGALADPRLRLFRGETLVAENDNWNTGAQLVEVFASVGAFPFVARARDAVLLITLPPGDYTAQVSGLGAAPTGVALVEVYALP